MRIEIGAIAIGVISSVFLFVGGYCLAGSLLAVATALVVAVFFLG